MKKSFMRKVVGIVSFFMVLLFLLQIVLQTYSSRRHFFQSADILIDQIWEILDSRQNAQRNLSESLKSDYIVRA